MSNRTMSPLGLAQLQAHEGFWPDAVALIDGRFVVGYGHVCQTPPARAMTKPEAAAQLAADLAPFEAAVNEMAGRPLSQDQFDALVSFAFSIGVEAFSRSDVLRRVKAGEFAAAAYAMDAWRKTAVGGESAVVEALVRRRAAERALLLGREETGAPSAWLKPELDHAAAILGAPAAFGVLPPLAAPLEALPAPANDSGPLLLTQSMIVAPPEEHSFTPVNLVAPKQRVNWWAQAALAAAAVGGLALMGWAGRDFMQGASDSGTFLFLGLPGVAATLAGVFFLTRGARPVLA